MKKLVLVTLMFFSAFALAAGDAEAGKTKAATCVACHGQNGIAIAPLYPNLAGQNAMYLEMAMKAYQTQDRKGAQAALMYPMVVNLSEQDIADLAAYFAAMKP